VKLVVGITGASGAPYARATLAALVAARKTRPIELAVVLSSTAQEVWSTELEGDLEEHVRSLDIPVFRGRDYRAPFASGSAKWDSMVIVPCSMSTVARIAHGTSDSLLTRAADVILKERRRLVLVPRETPLSVIHLENLLTVARAGAVVLPAMPSFYARPRGVDDVLHSVVGRILDQLGLDDPRTARWGTPAKEVP